MRKMNPDYFLKMWRPYVLIIIISFSIYAQALSFGYVDLDELYLIVADNQFLSDISNFFHAFTRDVFSVGFHESSKSYYRPLLTLSFMIDAQFGGIHPFVYHLSNILYHIVSSCLLFLFLLKMGFRRDISLFFGLIFSVHPVLSLAVAYVPGRNDSLMTVFVLISFISLINALDRKSWTYYSLSLFSYLMALFTKESAIGLVIIFPLYIFLFNKEKLSLFFKSLLATGWITTTALWLIFRSIAVDNPGMTVAHLMKSVMTSLTGVIQYTGKILIPVNLSVYPIMKDIPIYFGIAAVVILAALIVLAKNRRLNVIFFGLCWFIIFLLPSLASLRPGFDLPLFEHRVYLPLIGIIIILVETGTAMKLGYDRPGALLVGAAMIAFLSYMTVSQSKYMKDPLSFWGNAVQTSPSSSVAHLNLGAHYYKNGLIDGAERETKISIKLDPEQYLAFNNLGLIYSRKKMFGEAERAFRDSLEINPEYEDGLFNLGRLYYALGNLDKAISLWHKTLDINAYHIGANGRLANLYYYGFSNIEQARYHVTQLLKRGVNVNPALLSALNLSD
jgi:Tfp pilus assembly protein PilF